jgi:hypothetical protein
MKTWELKAETMTTGQLDRWLAGKIPRRHLAIPFGGPIKGRDLDGEFFDADTDLYGPLRQYGRERLVDWHHVTFAGQSDPVNNAMKGAILGRIVMDPEPSEEDVDGEKFAGIWADFWANAGEKRRQLVAALERRQVPLYGSSQALAKATRIGPDGHIDVWPVTFHTITTTPQNTHAVLPAFKASLDDPYLAELSVGALRAFLAGADDLGRDLHPTSPQGADVAKAGRVLSGVNERDLDEAVTALEQALERARTVLTRARERSTQTNE